jgi:dihydrolipoamide dehydrogenase
MSLVEVRVPELGDAKGVTVVDVLVKKGSEIRIDDPLITLETEKASMDVPSPVSGVVESIELKKGDEVSAGVLIAMVQGAETSAKPAPAAPPAATVPPAATAPPAATIAAAAAVSPAPPGAVDLVVLGAGVGGYTAAFRAADLGLKVTLIERWPVLGGV